MRTCCHSATCRGHRKSSTWTSKPSKPATADRLRRPPTLQRNRSEVTEYVASNLRASANGYWHYAIPIVRSWRKRRRPPRPPSSSDLGLCRREERPRPERSCTYINTRNCRCKTEGSSGGRVCGTLAASSLPGTSWLLGGFALWHVSGTLAAVRPVSGSFSLESFPQTMATLGRRVILRAWPISMADLLSCTTRRELRQRHRGR